MMHTTKQVSTQGRSRWQWLMTGFLMLVLFAPASEATVRAMLDRDTIYTGDTVTLTLETDGSDQDADPDLSVLETDFDILGTGSSRQIQIINGRRSDKHQWQIELDPKHNGEITIPAIPVGKAQTEPLTLKIEEPPEAVAGSAGQPVFLQLERSEDGTMPFVQQQVRLNMRLFYRIPLVEGSFDDPQPENAVVERLGDDRQYQTSVDGQPYQVIERRYAIFPEKSGTLTIPPINFTGRVVATSGQRRSSTQMDSMLGRFFGGRNPFDDPFFSNTPFGNTGKRIRVRSQPLVLNIRPRPENYQGRYWLPSADLILEDSWAEEPPEFRVGEPVNRTITLRAEGLESSQLPDIELPAVEHMRIYPEQAVSENHTDGERVFGTRKQELAYVPSRPGHFTLPEIRIDWWDTVHGKQQTATVPAWEINVLPGTGGSTASTTPEPPAVKDQPAHSGAAAEKPANRETPAANWLAVYWPWLLAGAAVVTGLMLIAARRRHPAPVAASPQTEAPRSTEARRALQQACETQDPRAAAHALLSWAAGVWPDQPPRSLGALAQRIDTGLEPVRELDHVLYSADHSKWNGKALWDAFNQGLVNKAAQETTGNDGLSPLYPQWGDKQAYKT